MKLQQALIVAALSLSVLVGDTFAQDSDGRMFGNGRFLKKMRDDIFGTKKTPKLPLPSFKPQTPAKKGFSLTGKSNVPTPALPTEGNRPSPIDTRATYKPKAPQVQSQSRQTQRSLVNKSKASGSNSRSTSKTSISPEAIESVTRSGKKPTLAFGMLLQTRGEDLVVTQVDPTGNANKAGVRKGDLIVGAGGIDFGSMLEFNEITSVLTDGDQLEFVVNQDGKKNKKLILFGEAPDMTPREVIQSPTAASSRTATTENRSGSNLGQYQIAPANSNMHSVIDSGASKIVPQKTSQRQNWRYNTDHTVNKHKQIKHKQIQAVRSASIRGETVLNRTK